MSFQPSKYGYRSQEISSCDSKNPKEFRHSNSEEKQRSQQRNSQMSQKCKVLFDQNYQTNQTIQRKL